MAREGDDSSHLDHPHYRPNAKAEGSPSIRIAHKRSSDGMSSSPEAKRNSLRKSAHNVMATNNLARHHRYLSELRSLVTRPRLYASQFLESLLQADFVHHPHHQSAQSLSPSRSKLNHPARQQQENPESIDRRSVVDEGIARVRSSDDIGRRRLWMLIPVEKSRPGTDNEDGKSRASSHSRKSSDQEFAHLINNDEKMQQSVNARVSNFDDLLHVPVWHRQGLKAPPLVSLFPETCYPQGLKAPPLVFKICTTSDSRRFYMLLLPQVNAEQQEHCLCCRRKAKGKKFRFSLDESKMTKRNNPNYVGKMKEQRPGVYEVYLRRNMLVITIDVTDSEVSAELQNQFLNSVELGRAGRTVRGNVQTFVDPMLALKVDSSKRTVLKVTRPGNKMKEVAQATSELVHPNATYLVDFDYPLSIFLSFSILCATVDSLQASTHG
eukprot:CAMPEP_0114521054 /NCGR_PEP_ID=MMETSP0109-20121206/19971_1 /TAXON_ID=29199 /ORGANISM="Chlorarachnion reptans, Strain CCCM449" /LENGTH=436 /DNA_ID=CAMNT_0001702113 /DNA_START=280 /DNA_END=1590 /DNA_ORIENTATION=+